MKYVKTAAALLCVSLLSGCTFGTSIDTLLAPPKLSIEQEQIYNALTYATGTSISLKYPKSGKYLSAFIVEDIDGDGSREALVFYEKNSLAVEENTLRINVLDRDGDNGGWRSVYDTPADGSEIERVMISKLGSNSRMNLIIGSSLINRSEKNVTVYSYSSGRLERTFSGGYSVMDITDLDQDGENEFLLLKGSAGSDPAAAEVYKLDDEGKYHQFSRELGGSFTEFDSVKYGELTDGKRGLYIDALSGTGQVQTDVMFMDDKGLKKVFSTAENSAATQRPAGCSTYDVDGDGRLEIPVQFIAPGYEELSEGEQLRLTNWLTVTDDGGLERKYTSYYSIGDGYIFVFPEKWRNKVTLRRDAVNDEIVFCVTADDKNGRELMRIYYAQDDASREDRIASGYMLLGSKGGSAYLAFTPKTSNDDGLSVTSAEVAVGFKTK